MRVGRGHRGPAFRNTRGAIVALAAALWLSGLAAAGPGHRVEADLTIGGPVLLDGPLRAVAGDATFVLVPPSDGSEVASADAASGALRVVTTRRDVVINPLGGEHWMPAEHDVQTTPLSRVRVVLHDAREDFVGLATPMQAGPLDADLSRAPRVLGLEAEPRAYTVGYDAPHPYYFRHEVPAGSFQVFCEGEDATLRGAAMQLAVSGAVLEVQTAEGLRVIELGDRMEPAGTAGGAAPLYRKVTTFAVLALEGAELRVGPSAGAVLYSQSPQLHLDGRLVVQRASGMVAFPGAAARAVGESLTFEGRFVLDGMGVTGRPGLLAAERGETRMHVAGSASQVYVGGQALALAPALPEAAAPAALLLAAVLAWVTGLGPKALAMAATPLFAAATPQVLLANDRRQAIYQAVLRAPGIHMRELHRLTGMRWGSLQYHTAVLVGTGVLVATRAGRRTVLACDAHRLTEEQVRALHLLRSPRALRVASAVAGGRAATQRDIALHTGVSFRLVSRYLGVMESLGLVVAGVGPRPKRYTSTPRLAELLPHAVREAHGPSAGAATPASPPALPPA